MLALRNYLYLSLVIAYANASPLVLTPASPSSIANQLLGTTYNLGAVTSAGNAEQIGSFSGGNAAGFGIDSGIVLSSGSLVGSNDSEAPNQNEDNNADADIIDSQDSASISTTIQSKADSSHGSTTFGAVFCTCEDALDVNFQERAQVLVNGKLVYDRSKQANDARSTASFGFAMGSTASFSGDQCKCSNVETFTLPRSQTVDTIKIVVADSSDALFNSWIFLGILGHADQALATATQTQTIGSTSMATATSTISTDVQVATVLQTTTITQLTTQAASTVTITAATSTSTVVNPACTNYVVQFGSKCCPRQLLRKVPSSKSRRGLQPRQQASTTATSVVATTTVFVTSTAVLTTTLDVVYTTSSTTTQVLTETATSTIAAATVTATIVPIATVQVCKQVMIPIYRCPKVIRNAKALLADERTFLNSYAKRPKSTWRTLEVHCDQDVQQYAYP